MGRGGLLRKLGSLLRYIMAWFKYKDGQEHEYKNEEQVKELKDHPDFVEVVKELPKPVKKKE